MNLLIEFIFFHLALNYLSSSKLIVHILLNFHVLPEIVLE